MTSDEAKEFVARQNKLGRDFVEAGKRQGSWAGFVRMVTEDLYPDQTHFLFELLQNAEDAGATMLNFDLSEDRLSSWHDGNRLFSKADVVGITSIGQSQKREDVNKIGKFGVGFKSVFAYTATPRISSGVFHFQITDLLCPEWVEPEERPNPDFTYVHLPFNCPSKTPQNCFKEIATGLDRLPDSTLLFLRKIEQVTWKVAGRGEGFIKKDLLESGIIRIQQRDSSGSSKTTHWLKFEAPLKETPELVCSVAFMLQPPLKKAADADSELLPDGKAQPLQFVIAPLSEPGHLHIFFPAGKETTGLFFLVHAPFAATVDRASIPFEHEGNRQLIEEIAALCASKLSKIKELGFLLPQFLGVLPNEKDKLDEFYSPIRAAIVNEFKENPLLPTHCGGYVLATHAMRGATAIRGVISPGDLRFLSGSSEALWAAGVMENTRESAFLDALRLSEFSWKELVFAIGSNLIPLNIFMLKAGQQWLGGKDGKWLGCFYALLDKAFEENKNNPHRNWLLQSSSIIRLADGSFTYGEKHPYFSPTMRVPKGLELPHVDESVFDEKKPKQAEVARSFLIKVGVKEITEEEVVKSLVATFYGADAVSPPNSHFQHIKLFMEWSAQAKSYEVFKDAKLLANSAGILSKSAALYLDEPFVKSGLAALFSPDWQHTHPRQSLCPGYVGKVQAAAFAKFAAQIGVAFKIGIEPSNVSYSNPEQSRLCYGWNGARNTHTGVNQDFWIPNLNTWLQKPTLQASRLIWEAMAAAAPETFTARYRPNSTYAYREAPSLLIVWLKTEAWLPNKAGEFKVPADLSRETLHPDFKFDEGYGWLTKVGFGDNLQRTTKAYADRVKVLSDIGVSREFADKLMGLTSDKLQQLLRGWETDLERSVDFPEKSVPDIERRTARATEQARKATSRTSSSREREVRVTKGEVDARTWLREEYTNEAGDMLCQMQGSAPKIMPFKYPDERGKFYFDACEFLGDLAVELRANYLALSPDCAAEFKHTCSLTDGEKRVRLLAIDPNGSPESLYLELGTPKNWRLRFTQAHLVDLQAAIRALG